MHYNTTYTYRIMCYMPEPTTSQEHCKSMLIYRRGHTAAILMTASLWRDLVDVQLMYIEKGKPDHHSYTFCSKHSRL
jgi:hypothetical protein